MLLLFGAFIAGLLTVLAPCVLPLLPIIIGGSISGDKADKKRPLIIAGSLAISLVVFTLLLKATSLLINLPPRAITIFSGSVIIIIGLFSLFPDLYARLLVKLGIEHRVLSLLGKGGQAKNQTIGAIITGAALGPVFSSCSPVYAYILATVLPVNFAQAFIYIISYILGLSLVMLGIGYFGQRFVRRIKFASDPRGKFMRAIAILFIIIGLMIATGYDKKFQTWVSVHTPFNFDSLSSRLLPASKHKVINSKNFNVEPFAAPEFVGLNSWINSSPLTLAQLKGKVVLVDFWTYSCINCIRNNPYLEKWYETYKDKGLVVIGMHAPEFAFEKVRANVEQGVKDQNLTYPVALDNDYATWNAFNNRSWPAGYLIDKDGNVRRVHEGEGEYVEEEEAIRALLENAGADLSAIPNTTKQSSLQISSAQTPETYLGSARASNYVGTPNLSDGLHAFIAADNLAPNNWTLSGNWEILPEKIIARGDSKLTFRMSAKEVYLVGGSNPAANVEISLNGQPISSTAGAGTDVNNSLVNFGQSRLYRLVKHSTFNNDFTLELTVPSGAELNAFTFGS